MPAFLSGPLGKTNLQPFFAGVPLKSLPDFSRPTSFLRPHTPRIKRSRTGHLTSHQNFVPPYLMRGKVFQQCLGRAFGNLLALTPTPSMGRDAHPDGTLFYRGSYLAVIEYKNESGAACTQLPDVYLVAARGTFCGRPSNVLDCCGWYASSSAIPFPA